MKCSRCGWKRPNPYCYACRVEEQPAETTDPEGTSLLKTTMRLRIIQACHYITGALTVLALLAVLACAAHALPYHAIGAFLVAIFFGFAAVICSHDIDAEIVNREWRDITQHPRI